MRYKNHHIMKKNRLIRFKQEKGMCEVCGEKARVIHHADESTDNHSLDNLIVLCDSCHFAVHRQDSFNARSSVMIRKYGLSTKDMVIKYGRNCGWYYSLHVKSVLSSFLADPLNFKTKTSKFIRLYGYSLPGLVEKWGHSQHFYRGKHKNNTLKKWISKKELIAT